MNIRFIQRGWHNANSILIEDNHAPVLIDTGHESGVDVLLDELDGVVPALIVNTHCHWDHHGGNLRLQQLSGAPIMMGSLTADVMACEDRHFMWMSYFGVEMELSKADCTVEVGDVVDFGRIPFQVISLAGHAPDMIGFYSPDEKVLICADALMSGGDCGLINVAIHGWEALDSAENTLRNLHKLDIDLALPGHGPQIKNVKPTIEILQRRLARFRTKPARLVQHLARRVLMAGLLFSEPVEKEEFLQYASQLQWLEDYAPIMGVSAETLLHKTFNDLIRGRVIKAENGILTATVPK